MTMFVAICNSKGGTGKSTTAVSLAALAASHGYRTLLVDTDMQQSSSFLSRGQWDTDAETAAALFSREPSLASQLTRPTDFGYDLIPAGARLGKAEHELAMIPYGELQLRKLFKRDIALQQNYDIVFIDTSANKTTILNSVLLGVSHLIIPMEPSNVALADLSAFIPLIEAANENRAELGDVALSVLGVVFVRVSERRRSEKFVMETLATQLADLPHYPLSTIHIPDSAAVEDAALMRAPVTAVRPNELVSQRYDELFQSFFEGRLAQALAVNA